MNLGTIDILLIQEVYQIVRGKLLNSALAITVKLISRIIDRKGPIPGHGSGIMSIRCSRPEIRFTTPEVPCLLFKGFIL